MSLLSQHGNEEAIEQRGNQELSKEVEQIGVEFKPDEVEVKDNEAEQFLDLTSSYYQMKTLQMNGAEHILNT